MYDNSMYTTIPPEIEEDTTLCENCPYADGICFRAGYCIVEDVN